MGCLGAYAGGTRVHTLGYPGTYSRGTRVHTLGVPGYILWGYPGTYSGVSGYILWAHRVHTLGVPGYILWGYPGSYSRGARGCLTDFATSNAHFTHHRARPRPTLAPWCTTGGPPGCPAAESERKDPRPEEKGFVFRKKSILCMVIYTPVIPNGPGFYVESGVPDQIHP